MKQRLICASAAALLLSACSAGGPPPSLAGSWSGTITCYSMDSPLMMTVDAAKPGEARMALGEGGMLPWDASIAIDGGRVVTIKSHIQSGDAQLLTGTLDGAGNTITGAMDKQLCNKFTLTRGAAPG
jgi:hypothetical protein